MCISCEKGGPNVREFGVEKRCTMFMNLMVVNLSIQISLDVRVRTFCEQPQVMNISVLVLS